MAHLRIDQRAASRHRPCRFRRTALHPQQAGEQTAELHIAARRAGEHRAGLEALQQLREHGLSAYKGTGHRQPQINHRRDHRIKGLGR